MNTTISRRRVQAIFRKELRDYRRNGHIVATMIILPLIFVIPPLINVFALSAQAAIAVGRQDPLLYLLGIPALVPATIAAFRWSASVSRARSSLCSARRSAARNSFLARRCRCWFPRSGSHISSMR
jgi:hypothetical protein